MNWYKKAARLVAGRLFAFKLVCVYLALTCAVPTTNRPLIIRTEIRTTIRESEKNCVDIGFGYFARL